MPKTRTKSSKAIPESPSTSLSTLNILKLPHPGHHVGLRGLSNSADSGIASHLLQLRVDHFGREVPPVVPVKRVVHIEQALLAHEPLKLAGVVGLHDYRALCGLQKRRHLF